MKGIITEEEYLEYEGKKLKDMALKMRGISKQIPLCEIAKGTGLKWDTINRVRKGKLISFRALCRIEKFLQSKGLML